MTNVETTPANRADVDQTELIHQSLKAKALLPDKHLVDAGYVDATLLLKSQKHYGVTIIGSMRPNASWQSKTSEAYDISQFQINWHTNGLRKARYQGLDKVQLQHILTATAINFVRMVAWLNDIPFAQTRISRFALLRLNN